MCGEASDLTAPAANGEGMIYSIRLQWKMQESKRKM